MNNQKVFTFKDRSMNFALRVRDFVRKLPYNIPNIEYSKQLIRSSGSIGANYIEAGEGMSKRDCIKYLKISKKEAKECSHWIELIDSGSNTDLEKIRIDLLNESRELFYILCSIVSKMVRKE